MPINERAKKFEKICKSMLDTYVSKNHDYGDSFSESVEKFGPIAAVVRMNDKMNRINTLVKDKAQVPGESMLDSVLDLGTYSIMFIMELMKIRDKENEQ